MYSKCKSDYSSHKQLSGKNVKSDYCNWQHTIKHVAARCTVLYVMLTSYRAAIHLIH